MDSVMNRLSSLFAGNRIRSAVLLALLLDLLRVLWRQSSRSKTNPSLTSSAAQSGEDEREETLDDRQEHGPLILAIDCDGTLFNEEGEVSTRSINALRRFSQLGGSIVLATGHPANAIRKTAEKVGARSYVVCSSGAVVMESSSWTAKVRNTVSVDCAERLVRAIESATGGEVHVAVEGLDKWYVQSDAFFRELDLSIPGAKMGSRIARLGVSAQDMGLELSELWSRSGEPFAIRVLAIHSTWSAEELIDKLAVVVEEEEELHESDIELKHSGAPRGVFIGARDVHKAHALKQVCELLAVPSSRVVAFGDNMNDLEMLTWAGTGIAVGNAVPELKKVADKVSAFTNAEDSVAREVEMILDGMNDRAVMQDNLKRMQDQISLLEMQLGELGKENDTLHVAVEQHETFLEMLKTQSPARLEPTMRKRLGGGASVTGSRSGLSKTNSLSSFATIS